MDLMQDMSEEEYAALREKLRSEIDKVQSPTDLPEEFDPANTSELIASCMLARSHLAHAASLLKHVLELSGIGLGPGTAHIVGFLEVLPQSLIDAVQKAAENGRD